MTTSFYDLDQKVLAELKKGATDLSAIEKWQGKASGIGEYVSSWGVERFWALSRSPKLIGGELPDGVGGTDEQRRYFAWGVARVTLCQVVGSELGIRANMKTEDFQARYAQLNFNQQILVTEMLLEIADTIQFWTMRLKETLQSNAK
jgi:hypothetical protein